MYLHSSTLIIKGEIKLTCALATSDQPNSNTSEHGNEAKSNLKVLKPIS